MGNILKNSFIKYQLGHKLIASCWHAFEIHILIDLGNSLQRRFVQREKKLSVHSSVSTSGREGRIK